MRQVDMTHPSGLTATVPETAVSEHARAGWEIASEERPVPCPSCGRSLPSKSPPDQSDTDQAPAPSGASSSPAQGRRGSKGDKS